MSGFEKLDDPALVQLCKIQLPRDQRAFSCLVQRHEPALYRFALHMLSDTALAEEVTQDAFMQVFHHIDTFEGRSSFRTWLFSIARNGALGQIRSQSRYQQRLDSLAVITEEQSDDDQSMGDELERILRQLPHEQREVLTLRFVAGLDISEIASTLNIKLSAAKMRLYRATEAAQVLAQKDSNGTSE